MKKIQALIAATVVTGLVAVGMLLIGANALFNSNSVAPANSPTDGTVATTASNVDGPASTVDNTQVAALQNEISQYQTQLDQANTQLEQYQQILSALQARGVIQITGDGQIQLGRRGGDDGQSQVGPRSGDGD